MFSWAQKRKIAVFSVFFVLVIFVAVIFILRFVRPSPVTPPETRDLSVLWTRFFEVRDGFVDVASLLRNPNNFKAQKIMYSFKIYDKNNILIAIKEGETFAGPLERFVIFEPNISVGERVSGKALLDIMGVIFSEDQMDLRPKIDVLGTERFLEDIFSRVVVNIKNREEKSLNNVQSTIVLFDEKQNAIAVSSTEIPFLGIDGEYSLTFTWPRALNGVSSIEVFFREQQE